MLATESPPEQDCFHKARWPLHKALAWVLSRNIPYLERATPTFFAEVSLKCGGAEGEGWGLLHADMTRKMPDGSTYERVQILAYGTPDDGDAEELLPVSIVTALDWGFSERDDAVYLLTRHPAAEGPSKVYRNINLPSRAILHNYPIGSSPILRAMSMLGPAIDPREVGFLPLSHAAQWIAMKGNTFDFFASDAAVWKDACDDLIRKITRNQVKLIGRRQTASEPEIIDGLKLYGLPVDYPYVHTPIDIVLGHAPYITFRGPHYSEKDWMAGTYTDELWVPRQRRPEYTHLAVCAQDVEREWPAPERAAGGPLDRRAPIVVLPPLPARGGTQGKKIDDEPLYFEMAELLTSGECTSIAAAAKAVVQRAGGGGSPASKIDRLSRGYSEWAKLIRGEAE